MSFSYREPDTKSLDIIPTISGPKTNTRECRGSTGTGIPKLPALEGHSQNVCKSRPYCPVMGRGCGIALRFLVLGQKPPDKKPPGQKPPGQ